jgi:hypothetical protein
MSFSLSLLCPGLYHLYVSGRAAFEWWGDGEPNTNVSSVDSKWSLWNP